jgi:hypothetical protein
VEHGGESVDDALAELLEPVERGVDGALDEALDKLLADVEEPLPSVLEEVEYLLPEVDDPGP